jgi:hypothetical protein
MSGPWADPRRRPARSSAGSGRRPPGGGGLPPDHPAGARGPAGPLAIGSPSVFGLCLLAAALPVGLWWPAVPLIVLSLTTPALNVASQTLTAQLVPPEMLGRMGPLLTVAAFSLASRSLRGFRGPLAGSSGPAAEGRDSA